MAIDSHQSAHLFPFRLFDPHIRMEDGIPENWIVSRRPPAITVLTLSQDVYVERCQFGLDDVTESSVLGGLSVAVSDVFEEHTPYWVIGPRFDGGPWLN